MSGSGASESANRTLSNMAVVGDRVPCVRCLLSCLGRRWCGQYAVQWRPTAGCTRRGWAGCCELPLVLPRTAGPSYLFAPQDISIMSRRRERAGARPSKRGVAVGDIHFRSPLPVLLCVPQLFCCSCSTVPSTETHRRMSGNLGSCRRTLGVL
jgi:hypothetical protein